MNKWKKIIGFGLLGVIIAVVGLLTYVKFALPNIPVDTELNVELTPERIARGSYLANSVCLCMDCHSNRDWYRFSGPAVKNSMGAGGELFGEEMGLPGNYYAKNITPVALKHWSDGEIMRAITSGVSKDGKALFPIMPYPNYAKLDKEDIFAIIAYIRTIKPIENEVPKSESNFPINFIINTIPQRPSFSEIPDKNDPVAYGKYMLTAASCTDCHTPQDKGQPLPGMFLAGGMKFPLKTGGAVFSANITPDAETGIGNWTLDMFVNRFKVYADSSYSPQTIHDGDFNSEMPWLMYATMDTSDLSAIYAYLRTVEAVKHKVTKFTIDQN